MWRKPVLNFWKGIGMGIGVNEISNSREFLYSLFRASSYGIVRPSEIPQRKAIREELTMMILEGKVRRIVMQSTNSTKYKYSDLFYENVMHHGTVFFILTTDERPMTYMSLQVIKDHQHIPVSRARSIVAAAQNSGFLKEQAQRIIELTRESYRLRQ